MTTALKELVNILTLERLEAYHFKGQGSKNDGAEGTYGGHLIGQSVAAAIETVNQDRTIHSLHAYFLSAGQPGEPIDYEVNGLRDGRSFCSRKVIGKQDGRVLIELNASFCKGKVGLKFSIAKPLDFDRLPSPEELPRYTELMATQDPLPFREDWALEERGLDVRIVNAPWSQRGVSKDGGIRMWIRADGELQSKPSLHAAILAYQSDESLADNVLNPFQLTWASPNVFMVSLDHALWFHRPVDLNNWHFVEQWPVCMALERGVASGYVWNNQGVLVASFTQEALVRVSD